MVHLLVQCVTDPRSEPKHTTYPDRLFHNHIRSSVVCCCLSHEAVCRRPGRSNRSSSSVGRFPGSSFEGWVIRTWTFNWFVCHFDELTNQCYILLPNVFVCISACDQQLRLFYVSAVMRIWFLPATVITSATFIQILLSDCISQMVPDYRTFGPAKGVWDGCMMYWVIQPFQTPLTGPKVR